MKNLQDIIASGRLERYFLGDLSEKESSEIASLLKHNEEANAYVKEFELSLEKMAQENAISPPPAVKDRLFQELDDPSNTASVMAMSTTNNTLRNLAATIAIVLGVSSFWLYTQKNTLENKLDIVITENEEMQNTVNTLEKKFSEMSQWYAMVNDPNTRKYILNGNEKAPNAAVQSYVNHAQKKVVVNAESLPLLSATQDYQMWADVDGEMIDMGVIPKNSKMLAMQYIEDASSLNITIEPAGGNDHATVSQLVTNVYITP